MSPAPDDPQARALAAERDHVRRYRRVQQFTRAAFAVAAVAALALAWWLAHASTPPRPPPVAPPTSQTIEFSKTPLADVLAQLNRQNRLQLTLTDPALGPLPVSGALRLTDPAAFTRLLASTHGLRAEPRGDHELVLRR